MYTIITVIDYIYNWTTPIVNLIPVRNIICNGNLLLLARSCNFHDFDLDNRNW